MNRGPGYWPGALLGIPDWYWRKGDVAGSGAVGTRGGISYAGSTMHSEMSPASLCTTAAVGFMCIVGTCRRWLSVVYPSDKNHGLSVMFKANGYELMKITLQNTVNKQQTSILMKLFTLWWNKSFMSNLYLNYDILHGLCNWLSLWCVVPWMNHLAHVCFCLLSKSSLN